MAIEPGSEFLHYRIVEKIGEGGMGVVWKALDTTLDREVAIKVLPAMFAESPERLARFEREAKLLAALNHPNIATIHGLHEAPTTDSGQAGIRFLAMEYVEGEDLARRLAGGALPLNEALKIALQIAEAFEVAHERGIVHRDLKPANVRITPDGKIKVLDFGLARAFETDSSSGEVSPTMSPTLTSAGTVAGMILGTAAYMSPEQARGHTADARADVWALGGLLYEMLCGRSAFSGETISDTLASVLKLEPNWDKLPADTPHRIRRLLARCLRKDRKQRTHHVADVRIALEETLAGEPDAEAPTAAATTSSKERRLWVAALVLVAAVTGLTMWSLRADPPEPILRKLQVYIEEGIPAGFRISPDGRRVVYKVGSSLYIRDLNNWKPREINAAESADNWFWSADGLSLAFVRDQKLWRVGVDGGGATAIVDMPWPINGGAWSADGRIVVAADDTGLFEVSQRGGDWRALLETDAETVDVGSPVFLPGERVIAYRASRNRAIGIDLLVEGQSRELHHIPDELMFSLAYASSGHLIYWRFRSNSGIWALPFSIDKLEVTGDPFLVASNGSSASVSSDGTLVFRSGGGTNMRQLVWVDREGNELQRIGQPQPRLAMPSLSPDQNRVAVVSESDLWIQDIDRGTATRMTFDESGVSWPVWSPEGDRIFFEGGQKDSMISVVDAGGQGSAETLMPGLRPKLSPDGRYITFSQKRDETARDDRYFASLDGEIEPRLVIEGAWTGQISPDGEYIAYHSDESGRSEVYLKRFPSGEGKWQVSVDGGRRPHWNPAGGELFWYQSGGDLMAVDVQVKPNLTLGVPRVLFNWQPSWLLRYLEYDVSSDGQRFVLVALADENESVQAISMTENWSAEFDESD
jgi:serine/threonine protein kinase/sugar lactone lactonase YvrE